MCIKIIHLTITQIKFYTEQIKKLIPCLFRGKLICSSNHFLTSLGRWFFLQSTHLFYVFKFPLPVRLLLVCCWATLILTGVGIAFATISKNCFASLWGCFFPPFNLNGTHSGSSLKKLSHFDWPFNRQWNFRIACSRPSTPFLRYTIMHQSVIILLIWPFWPSVECIVGPSSLSCWSLLALLAIGKQFSSLSLPHFFSTMIRLNYLSWFGGQSKLIMYYYYS